jgi:hypothetical protein
MEGEQQLRKINKVLTVFESGSNSQAQEEYFQTFGWPLIPCPFQVNVKFYYNSFSFLPSGIRVTHNCIRVDIFAISTGIEPVNRFDGRVLHKETCCHYLIVACNYYKSTTN